MIATIFRCEFRSGRVLKPIPILMFLYFHWDVFYLLYFYYASFCCAFQQKSCPTILLYNSVYPIYKYLFSINLIQFICYQFYIAVFLLVQYYFFSEQLQIAIEQVYQTELLLIWAFILGNALSNTDLVSIKNALFRTWSFATVFGIGLYTIDVLLKYLEVDKIFFVLVSILVWYISTRLQRKINFPLFNIKI